MIFDDSLANHWPDILLAAFIATVGWLLRRAIGSMDARHERAENKFEKIDERISNHETRITLLEPSEKRRYGRGNHAGED